MIKADLVTGFLGSGKTTFIKKYAAYFMSQGERVSVLENDYGAVNVDRMLLAELEKAGCNIETIAGACDRDCHYRRFKTKLIALAMTGYDRVIIEPSGIFDTDEFFDVLREEPIDRLYEPGAVVTVVDAAIDTELSEQSRYLLACQCAAAGKIYLSRTQLCTSGQIENTKSFIGGVLKEFGSKRKISDNDISEIPIDSLTGADITEISGSGYKTDGIIKAFGDVHGLSTLYFMNTGLSAETAKQRVAELLSSEEGKGIFRVKGFAKDGDTWWEINATHNSMTAEPSPDGQDVMIVIGEKTEKERIEKYFMSEK